MFFKVINYKHILKPTIILILLIILFFLFWIKLKFGIISHHILIVNIQILKNELFQSNIDTIKHLNILISFYKWVLVLPISITFLWSLTYFYNNYAKKIFIFINKHFFILSVIFLLISISIVFAKTVSISLSKKNLSSNVDTFKSNYKFIEDTSIIDPQNLILVILESYDRDFINTLDNNLLNEIDNLNFNNFNSYEINNFYSNTSAQISLHAQIEYLCGVFVKFDKQTSKEPYILKNHLCLQDILNLNNYNTELIMSTPLTFHSSHRFYLKHSFDNIYDASYFNNSNLFNKNFYSLFDTINDEDLILFTQDRLNYLNNLKENFFVTLVTLDTHAPGNYYDKNKCKSILTHDNSFELNYNSKYFRSNSNLFSNSNIDLINNVFSNRDWVSSNQEKINSFKCTNQHLINFLRYIDKSNLDTNILLIADHGYSNGSQKRKLYNKLLTKKKIKINQLDNFYPLDIFPTLLDLSGYKNINKQIYLGYSAINTNDLSNNREENFNKIYNSSLDSYQKLW